MTKRKKRQLKLDNDANKESDAAKRQRMCGHKVQYNSDLEALAWGRASNERRNENKEWDTYFCPYCRHWHLTRIGE
jgi:hypothetical protein